MTQIIEMIFLGPWTIFVILTVALLFLTRWAIIQQREYIGYGLGWLVALFFIVVYSSLGGGADPDIDANATLNIFQVFLATMLGMVFGGGTMGSFRFGMRFPRGLSLYVAFVTALNLILLFIAIIGGPIEQRMIGIFALAFGITSGFVLVLIAPHDRLENQGAPANPPVNGQTQSLERSFDRTGTASGVNSGTSRLERIREDMQRRNNER